MILCTCCSHLNEDGTLFCEQCKSDLTAAMLEQSMVEPKTQPKCDSETGQQKAFVKDVIPIAEAILDADEKGEDSNPGTRTDRVTVKQAEVSFDIPRLPENAQPRLIVIRGLKVNMEYPLYEGDNYIGRADEKPVDIDLENQEASDRIWSSRQHARIIVESGKLVIEDMGSQNGTFVNRTRVHVGQRRPLGVGDVVQIGTVQLRVQV